jgi:hypothetical protein
MRLDVIQAKVRAKQLRIATHALTEASKDGIRATDIAYGILHGTVIERYPERNRLLIYATLPTYKLPLHIVCDYTSPTEIVVTTVYIPSRAQWLISRKRKPLRLSKKRK